MNPLDEAYLADSSTSPDDLDDLQQDDDGNLGDSGHND